jgi:predicted dehydrogenase
MYSEIMYTAAVVGCGRIGCELADDPLVKGIYTHAGAYAYHLDTKLVAFCDTNLEKLLGLGKRWADIGCFTSLDSMLSVNRPDIVSICTPDETHYEIARKCMESGVRALLVEKPLATGARAASELVKMADERGVKLAVNFIRRYDINHTYLRQALLNGKYGKVKTVTGYYSGGLIHNGIHWLDLACFLFGKIDWVWGTGQEPSPSAYLHFSNGITGFLQYSNVNYTLFEMDIICTEGRVRIIDSGYTIEVYKPCPSPHFTGFKSLALVCSKEGLADPTLYAVDDLVRCLLEDRQPLSSGKDGLRALEIAELILESAHSGFGRILCRLNQ